MECPLYDAQRFLPQTGKMAILNEIIFYDENNLQAYAHILNDNIFLEQESFPAWATLELMAQGIAALDGIHSALKGESPKLGFLLGTRKFTAFFDIIQAPCSLMVSVAKSIQDESGMGVFDCELSWPNAGLNTNNTIKKQPFAYNFVLAKAALNVFSPRKINPKFTNYEK